MLRPTCKFQVSSLTESAIHPASIQRCGFNLHVEIAAQMDVWALGVCIYCWIFGHLPFVGQTILETFEAIKNDELTFNDSLECSEELRDLLCKVSPVVPACIHCIVPGIIGSHGGSFEEAQISHMPTCEGKLPDLTATAIFCRLHTFSVYQCLHRAE